LGSRVVLSGSRDATGNIINGSNLSGIVVISLLFAERWRMPAEDFFPDIYQ